MTGAGHDRPQSPTFDDVRRLLECVQTLHLSIPAERPRVLAEQLVSLLNASVVALDAGHEGNPHRLATVAAAPTLPKWPTGLPQMGLIAHGTGRAGQRPRAGTTSARRKTSRTTAGDAGAHAENCGAGAGGVKVVSVGAGRDQPSHEVKLLSAGPAAGQSTEERPAGVQSIYIDGDRVSAVTAWRPTPFHARHVTLLQLIHPPTAWIYGRSRTHGDLPDSTDSVLQLMLRGMPEKEIARRLGRSAHTVHAHVKRVYRHYGVRSRPELLARML